MSSNLAPAVFTKPEFSTALNIARCRLCRHSHDNVFVAVYQDDCCEVTQSLYKFKLQLLINFVYLTLHPVQVTGAVELIGSVS